MSFDDDFAADSLPALYEEFGVDATVQRGLDAPVPGVRLIVDRGQERVGDFGSVIGRIDSVGFMCSQWTPVQGDVVRWTDRFGSHEKQIESLIFNDGLEARAVLHG